MTLRRKRPVVGGLQGAVASAHPLASQAGLDIPVSYTHLTLPTILLV